MNIEELEKRDDWLAKISLPELVAFSISGLMLLVVYLSVPMNPLMVPDNDSLSKFPHVRKVKMPDMMVVLLAIVIPIAIFIACYLLGNKVNSVFSNFHLMRVIWVFGIVITNILTITELMKRYVGRARPDIYNACKENNVQFENCTKLSINDKNDQFKSWPSGHSSVAMGSFLFTALFTHKVIMLKSIFKIFISLLFILFAFYIGATRIRDFRHHTDDVIAGLFLGYIISSIIWKKTEKSIFHFEYMQNFSI